VDGLKQVGLRLNILIFTLSYGIILLALTTASDILKNVPRQIKDQNIVIVEDDDAIAQALNTYFSAQNTVQICNSAEEAIAAEANFHDIDVFILDYKLPGKNGAELFEHLQGRFREAKYILITGELNYDLAERTRQIGFDALILKPFDFTILDDNIASLITTSA